MAKNNEAHARLLMKEMKALSDKYGISHFEEEHLDVVIESLDEITDEVLEPIMKDPLARAALAATIVTLMTMDTLDGVIVIAEDDLEDFLEHPGVEQTTKKKQTTH